MTVVTNGDEAAVADGTGPARLLLVLQQLHSICGHTTGQKSFHIHSICLNGKHFKVKECTSTAIANGNQEWLAIESANANLIDFFTTNPLLGILYKQISE